MTVINRPPFRVAAPGVRVLRLALTLWTATLCGRGAAQIQVSTDFEGGSARILEVNQTRRVIRFMPGGDPARGWPCWWFLKAEGLEGGTTIEFELHPSDALQPQQGPNMGKPLSFAWASPDRAAISFDRQSWKHTDPGIRAADHITYSVEVPNGVTSLWLAWGPAFTPRDTGAVLRRIHSKLPDSAVFTLATTLEGRKAEAIQFPAKDDGTRPVVWIEARQHAWESGGSWVCAGFLDWLASDGDPLAAWIRTQALVVAVPIMDVDHVATGDGGKDALPQDHNRDWMDAPHWKEVAAAQRLIAGFGKQGRLEAFIDLHNPGARDKTFFFVSPQDMLGEDGRRRQERFLGLALQELSGPIPFDPKARESGASYQPLWKQISKNWVHTHAAPDAISVTLENAWNTPASTVEGYLKNGAQLGRTLALYLQWRRAGQP